MQHFALTAFQRNSTKTCVFVPIARIYKSQMFFVLVVAEALWWTFSCYFVICFDDSIKITEPTARGSWAIDKDLKMLSKMVVNSLNNWHISAWSSNAFSSLPKVQCFPFCENHHMVLDPARNKKKILFICELAVQQSSKLYRMQFHTWSNIQQYKTNTNPAFLKHLSILCRLQLQLPKSYYSSSSKILKRLTVFWLSHSHHDHLLHNLLVSMLYRNAFSLLIFCC